MIRARINRNQYYPPFYPHLWEERMVSNTDGLFEILSTEVALCGYKKVYLYFIDYFENKRTLVEAKISDIYDYVCDVWHSAEIVTPYASLTLDYID